MVLKINNIKRHQQNLGQDGRQDHVAHIPLTKTFYFLLSFKKKKNLYQGVEIES